MRVELSSLGNFGFDIEEYTNRGKKHGPEIGIYGMDIYVALARPGFNVALLRHAKNEITPILCLGYPGVDRSAPGDCGLFILCLSHEQNPHWNHSARSDQS